MGSAYIELRNALKGITPLRIGGLQPPRLGVLLGITPSQTEFAEELRKARDAKAAGADTLTDVTTLPGSPLRRAIARELDIPLGTVPAYDIFTGLKPHCTDLRAPLLTILEQHAKDGADFFSIHASLTQALLSSPLVHQRTIPITSRGGAMIAHLMSTRNCENPFFTYFDDVLDLARSYNIALSLVGTFRPGSVADALDPLHLRELAVQAELVRLAHTRGVQTMVELLNHVPLHLIPTYSALGARLFDDSPLGALGPSPTDIAVGLDDVAGAIGAAVSAQHGVSWINVITAAEHCYLPTRDDMMQAIRYFQTALHIGAMAKSGDVARDTSLSRARRTNSWSHMADSSICPALAETIFREQGYYDGQPCTMCHSACPLVRTRYLLGARHPSHKDAELTLHMDTQEGRNEQ